jgi:peptide chain release factor 1
MWPKTVTKADLRIDFFRAGGPGGQNQNKRDSACRITHIPTGISSESRVHKEQLKNKTEAFRKLANKLVPLMKAAINNTKEVEKITERIRTYHAVRGTVKDGKIDLLV